MAETPNDTRALSAALAGPAFVSKGGGGAMHAANRHVERWAPEANAHRVRPLRNLGFVDRLVSPWIEAAQRSASLRMFSQVQSSGMQDGYARNAQPSWVFPRPWYQDELDWMAASRETAAQQAMATSMSLSNSSSSSAMLTTRGTYVAPAQQTQVALPSALYEFVAPSLSIAPPQRGDLGAPVTSHDAYSPLVPFAAVQAAHVMSSAVAPIAQRMLTPNLKAVLQGMLERSAQATQTPIGNMPIANISQRAPELVTPPAPRPELPAESSASAYASRAADDVSAQRAQIAELQRQAQLIVTQREQAARAASAAQTAQQQAREVARIAELQQKAQHNEEARTIAAREAARAADGQRTSEAAERARVEERVAQRMAERAREQQELQTQIHRAQQQQNVERAQRLHDQARDAAARDARELPTPSAAAMSSSVASSSAAQQPRIPDQLATAIAGLSPQLATTLASGLAQQPERAAQTITELHDALRTVELMARTAAAGGSFESARGPRLVMPAGLGGLVATVDRNVSAADPVRARAHDSQLQAMQAAQLAAAHNEAQRQHYVQMQAAQAAHAQAVQSAQQQARTRMPAMTWLQAPEAGTTRDGYAAAAREGFAATAREAAARDAAAAGATTSTTASAAQGFTVRDGVVHFNGIAQRDFVVRDGLIYRDGVAIASATGAPLAASVVVRDGVVYRDGVAVGFAGGAAAGANAPMSAFVATQMAQPAALQHVAWADRWLARFAGARGPSLDLLTASSATAPDARFAALASAAPDAIFVAPQFDGATAQLVTERSTPLTPEQAPPMRRYDDNEETPLEELVAISQAAARARTPQQVTVPELRTFERASLADAVAHAVPSAPNAGLSAQLASSPFAPAFRHVFPLASAPTFDVRALFGDTLSAAYLAGLLSPATREVATGAAIDLPSFGAMFAGGASPLATAFNFEAPITRSGLDWSPTYVSPTDELANAELSSSASLAASQISGASPELAAAAQAAQVAATAAAHQAAEHAAALQQAQQITTMRSALLSWDVESVTSPMAPSYGDVRVAAPSVRMDGGGTLARSMVEAMALPMLGDRASHVEPGMVDMGATHAHVPTFAAPGMIADRAQAWSIAQERSASDLAFDFVTPELVLAARVYGLGPVEAAQAMRLAIAGPNQLATMASTVDRTFVQALAIEAERRERAQQTITAYPQTQEQTAASAAATAASIATAAALGAPSSAFGAAYATTPGSTPATSAARSTESAFGVERRTPRGAFMWPPGTVAALGLAAAAPDGEHGMSVAALELLAAQSVAALGTFAALGPAVMPADAAEAREARAAELAASGAAPSYAMPSAAAAAAFAAQQAGGVGAGAAAATLEASESDVLASATAMVPMARRSKFEAMYVALGQSATTRAWTPAARAARALALAGRGDDAITAQERAQVAWDVLPVVAPMDIAAMGLVGDDSAPGATMSTGVLAQRQAQMQHMAQLVQAAQQKRASVELPDYVESRPGLAGLSARAGEALTSFVAPVGSPMGGSRERTSRDETREHGALLRAPTAAQELVRTGRPAGRFGGGEAEIPTWFEQAARKMFDSQTGSMSDGISLAELTLVSAAPSTAIAASTRGVPSAAPANPNPSSTGGQGDQPQNSANQIDVEKIAVEVYRQILTHMDSARARNGEPYL